jgi:hypothetical protein
MISQIYEGPCPLDPEYKVDLESTGAFRMPMFDDLMTKSTGALAPEFTRDMYERVHREKMRATVDRTVTRMKEQFTYRIPLRFDPVADTMAALQVAWDKKDAAHHRYDTLRRPVGVPYGHGYEEVPDKVTQGQVVREEEDATVLFDRSGEETDNLIDIWNEEQERINARANRKYFKRIRTFCHLVGVAFHVAFHA